MKRLVIFIFCFLFLASASAANYYIDDNGCSDSYSGTSSQPWCTFTNAFSQMVGGDTLIVKDGYYPLATSQNSAILDRFYDPPSGSETTYTTVRAENDGGVVIDGFYNHRLGDPHTDAVLSIGTDYVKIEGLKFINGDDSTATLEGNHIEIRRCAFANTGPLNNIVQITGKYILLEDSWIWGSGSSGVMLYGGQDICGITDFPEYVTLRRVVIRTDKSTYDGGSHGAVMYGAQDVFFENVIVLDNMQNPVASTGNYRTGIRTRGTPCTENINNYGTIVLNLPVDVGGYGYSGYEMYQTNGVDCIAWDVGGVGFFESGWQDGFSINRGTVGDTGGNPTYFKSMSCTNCLIDPTNLEYLPEGIGSNGAKIINRYENEILTSTPLWPWPYEDRLKTDMCDPSFIIHGGETLTIRGFCTSGNGLYGGPRTLTSYIWEYLGNSCPQDICNGEPPLNECEDNIDNDNDGAVDMADSGCSTSSDNDETNCGDGVCEGGESSASCSQDCGSSSVCGNSIIESPEQCDNGTQSNGVACSAPYNGECVYCSSNCLQITTIQGAYCGDGTCNSGNEDENNCPQDCEEQNPECSSANVICVDDTSGINQEYQTIQEAADVAGPGDTVLVFPGNYAGFQVTTSGTSQNQKIFKAYSSGVIINSGGPTGDGVRLQNVDYITIDGFEIQDLSERCIAARGATPTSPMTGHIISNNYCQDCTGGGFYLSEVSNSLVENNTIIRTGLVVLTHGIYLANAGSDNTIIRNNSISESGNGGIHFNGDLSVGGDGIISGLIVEKNIIFNNGQNGLNMDGVQDSIIRNNIVYGNARHALRAYDIDASEGPKNLQIINNNLIAGSSGWPIKLTEDEGGHTIFNNNLFSPNGAIVVGNTNFVSDYNRVSDSFSLDEESSTINLASWQSQGYGTHSEISSTNIFVNYPNNFHLIQGCSSINTGINNLNGNSAPSSDFENNARPQGNGYDIGAYEYSNFTKFNTDLDNDGDVDLNDFEILNSGYGTTYSLMELSLLGKDFEN